jgi:tRNA pseudouridine55 synthase
VADSKLVTSGLVLIDKPAGITSHDVVARVRRLAGTKKVGHAGTLDPMATGLLVLGINSATKLLTFVVGQDKAYLATIRLGAATVTDDAEGDFFDLDEAAAAEAAQKLESLAGATGEVAVKPILEVIASLTGEILQVPSSVSAIKVDGERAYALVRGGDTVKLKARSVTVSRFDLVGDPRVVFDLSENRKFIDLDVVVDCSSGTYIRALARDLGAALGVGGHLTALRRTRIGGYDLGSAQVLPERDQVADLIGGPNALPLGGLSVEPLAAAAARRFATLKLDADQTLAVRQGKRIGSGGQNADVAAIGVAGELVAILTPANSSEFKSLVVFADV